MSDEASSVESVTDSTAITAEASTKKSKKGKEPEVKNAFAGIKTLACDDDKLKVPGLDTGAPEHLVKLHGKRVRSVVNDVLLASVEESGVQQPAKCVKVGQDLWVFDGVQRLRALRAVNVARKMEGKQALMMPYQVVPGLSAAQVFKLGLQLNQSHKEDDILDRSAKAAELMRLLMLEGKSLTAAQQGVAEAEGVSKSLVEGFIAAHSATPALKKAYEEGYVNASVLVQLAALPAPEQELAAKDAEGIIKRGEKPMTTAGAKDRVKASKGQYRTGKCFAEPALLKAIIRAHLEDGVDEMDKDVINMMRIALKQVELVDVWATIKGFRASVAYVTGENTKGEGR